METAACTVDGRWDGIVVGTIAVADLDGTTITAIATGGYHGESAGGWLGFAVECTTAIGIIVRLTLTHGSDGGPIGIIAIDAIGKKNFLSLLKRLWNSFDKLFLFLL